MITPLTTEADAHYRAVFEASDDAIFVTDGEGRFLDANPAALVLLGYTRAELLQLHVRNLLLPEPVESAAAFTRLKHDGVWSGESRLRHKDGLIVWTESRTVQVELPEGTRYVGTFRDRTAHKQSEAALRESEARYRALFKSIDHGFCIIEEATPAAGAPLDFRYTDANPAFTAISGFTDVVGKTTRDLLPEGTDDWLAIFEAVLRTGEPIRVERELAPLGMVLDLYAFRLDDTPRQRVAVLFKDVTVRAHAEAALRASEERYRALALATANAVWRSSADGAQVIAIEGGVRHSDDPGLTPTRVWLSQNVHPSDQEPALRAWSRAVASRSVYDYVHRLVTPDGGYRHIRSRGVPLFDEEGTVREWIGTSTDITEQVAAEATNTRLAAIVESSQDAILSETPDGIILDWNPGAEALYGYTAEEAVGRHMGFLVPPEHAHEPTEVFARLRRGERVPPYETVRLRKDGTRVAAEVRLSPFHDADGRMVGVSAIARDITERKRLEQLRQDVQAMVGHDLRSPLAVIDMLVQKQQRRQSYDPEGLEAIQEQAQRMTRMIDDLGDAIRLESGQLVLHLEAVDFGMLAHEAAERALTQTDRHAIRVALPETPVIGTWDRVRLEEVLDNLIGNAVKYSPDGGEILVEVVASTEEAQLRVVDGGLGISEADLLRLFERFHRAEGTGLPGLGLGLYITRMLVEAHGGRIDVASVPGEGSAFTVWLPLLSAAEPDPVRSRSGN